MLLSTMAACQPSRSPSPDDAAIHIAVAGPMSGQYEVFGTQLRLGAEGAVSELNASGGVLGKKLDLEVLDDRCDPRIATWLANQAASEGVVFVDGHFCSSASIPASAVYDQSGIVMISPASTNPSLTDKGLSLVFRVVHRDSDQGRFAADHVLDRRLSERIGTVHDGSTYGKSLVEAFTDRVEQRGGTLVGAYAIRQGKSDYPSLIASLRSDQVGLVYFGGYSAEAAAIARGAARAGVSIQLVGGDALVDKAFWAEAGGAGEGTLMPFGSDPRLVPAAREAVATYNRQGVDSEGYLLYSYAAVQVWSQAAERAGDTRGDLIADILRGGAFPTVIGDLKFDSRGDVEGGPPWEMQRWSAGRYSPVGRWLPGMWTRDRDTPSPAVVAQRAVGRCCGPPSMRGLMPASLPTR